MSALGFYDYVANTIKYRFRGPQDMARAGMFEFLKTRGMPTQKSEDWKYTNLRILNELGFVEQAPTAAVPDLSSYFVAGQINIIVVDGVVAASSVLPTSVKMSVSPAIIENAPGGNGAGSDVCFFDSVAQLCKVENIEVQFVQDTLSILNVVHVISGNVPGVVAADVTFRVYPGVKCAIVEKFVSLDASTQSIHNVTIPRSKIEIQAGGSVDYMRVQSCNAAHISKTIVSLSEDATLKCFQLDIGNQLTRNDLNVSLAGAHSQVQLGGLTLLSANQHVDNHTVCFHKAPDCISRQLYKAILNQSSRSVFNGRIVVSQYAAKTEAYQLNKNLMLSDDCEVDTKPQLEIHCDDVKCTHGATIGALNADEKFYLESRGIAPQVAHAMLCEAFTRDVCEQISDSGIKSLVAQAVHNYFGSNT